MKRALLLVVAAASAVAIQRRMKSQQAERELWAEITDDPGTSSQQD